MIMKYPTIAVLSFVGAIAIPTGSGGGDVEEPTPSSSCPEVPPTIGGGEGGDTSGDTGGDDGDESSEYAPAPTASIATSSAAPPTSSVLRTWIVEIVRIILFTHLSHPFLLLCQVPVCVDY
ncbi:putative hydrophobin precursor protein [Zalerion maritima]|uniref:Hydrophobin protein n=1 Tax=Zalerion maritima TaxID=339359 RepID=A0AAD5WU67_9PEZI|nr:putative hydrophobin precursor protein [Zalerion maritima]